MQPRSDEVVPRPVCAITGRELPRKAVAILGNLRPGLVERIRREHPALSDDAVLDVAQVNSFRRLYVEELLREEHGEFTELDRQVTESIAKQDTIAENIEAQFDERRTAGERLSDGLAAFGGSWAFLIVFAGVMAAWILVNQAEGEGAFDPYPFILLNLVLSTIAAIQAPIIMMSQNRQEAKDRMRSLNDYRVNLKAELEIRHLHEKLDHLIGRQWERLAEIQQLQIELMQEARRSKG
ncbi:DUF1003 domain-containing protein [Falsiroseomonas oryziterrae]|uniref:DUF1003 domain-containing protein n=1 Tax=Falsiroseomonas oryziterrae TaxID=2911368 RepID=UPI001F3C6736|nr:DUF1003 domain-containing protein [Roseomonas sp. NPKOSM-4]